MNGVGEAAYEGRRCALERIKAAQAAGDAVSPLVSSAAQALGVAPRTVWRWLQQGPPGQFPSKAWKPSEDDVDCYVRWKGNAASAWRERSGASADVPALRTFQDAIARTLGPRTERADTISERLQLWLDSSKSSNLRESLANEPAGTTRHAVVVFDAQTEPEYPAAIEQGTTFCPSLPLQLPAEIDVVWFILGPIASCFTVKEGWRTVRMPDAAASTE